MKTLLEKIEEQIIALDPRDGDAHIWWGKFREFVKEHEFMLWAEEHYRHEVFPDLWRHKECTIRGKILNTDQLRIKYYEEMAV